MHCSAGADNAPFLTTVRQPDRDISMTDLLTPPYRSEFRNECGERWIVEIDVSRKRGLLRGDETDWEPLEIRDGAILGGFGLSDDEFDWLAAAWRQATGQELQPTWIQRVEYMLLKHRNAEWGSPRAGALPHRRGPS